MRLRTAALLTAACVPLSLLAPSGMPAASAKEAPGLGALPQLTPPPASMTPRHDSALLLPSVTLVHPEAADPAALRTVRQSLRASGVQRIRETSPGSRLAMLSPSSVWVGRGGTAAGLRSLGTAGPADLGAEGYVLAAGRSEHGRSRVVLAGADADGTFYAAQSLRQLIADSGRRPVPTVVPGVEIRDEPSMALRGTIEGFYGTPWSHADRLDQMDFYGRHKMNSYIYAPKDDPYHRKKWREPYPEQKAAQLQELIQRAKGNHVDFTFALSPGLSICFSSQSDVQALLDKFDSLYEMGVRRFNIPFDDISYTDWNCAADEERYGAGTASTAGTAQAELLNTVQREFVDTHEGVAPLQTVATEYYDVDRTEYKSALRQKLTDQVVVQWTGIGVIAHDITVEDARRAREVFGHEILLWDNYPVNDFTGAWGRLHLGPYAQREPGHSAQLTGITANPMNQAAASKIALFNVAEFSWNDRSYSPQRSWDRALRELADDQPGTYSALRTFADLNYLRPRIDSTQAPELAADIEQFWQAREQDHPQRTQPLRQRVRAIQQAPETLRADLNAPAFLRETAPWLDASVLWGQAMEEGIGVLDALDTGDQQRAAELRAQLEAHVTQAKQITDPNGYAQPDRAKTPVKIADGVADAFLQRVREAQE